MLDFQNVIISGFILNSAPKMPVNIIDIFAVLRILFFRQSIGSHEYQPLH